MRTEPLDQGTVIPVGHWWLRLRKSRQRRVQILEEWAFWFQVLGIHTPTTHPLYLLVLPLEHQWLCPFPSVSGRAGQRLRRPNRRILEEHQMIELLQWELGRLGVRRR